MAQGKADRKLSTVADVDKAIKQQLEGLRELRSGVSCYPLLVADAHIGPSLVDDIYDDLRANYACTDGQLDVIVHSGGGDIDAAYNLAQLFRRFGSRRLTFIIPRWAKSAATLLVCAGDCIEMTPVAELGPVDPQITEMNPLERRLEQFSPLHIESTLTLIREEYKSGNKLLADALMQRLQFPLTLGRYRKSLEIGKQYLTNLLSTRMIKDLDRAKHAAERLTEGYADHGFCIIVQEAKAIGLKAEEISDPQLEVVWEIHRLVERKREIEHAKRTRQMEKMIKELPRELLDKLPPELLPQLNDKASTGQK